MLHERALPSKKQKTNSSEKPVRQSLSSSITISVATAAICLLNSQQSVSATDFDTQIQANRAIPANFDFARVAGGDDHEHHNHSSGLLPRILSLITAPFKTQLGKLSPEHKHPQHSPTPYTDAMGGSFTQDLVPIYLSQANSTTNKEFSATKVQPLQNFKSIATPKTQLYEVKAGDTLNAIAKKYQISRDEIIKLNNLNSNIIFVSQQLKIPSTASNKLDLKPNTISQEKFAIASGNLPQSSVSQRSPLTASNYLADARLNPENLFKHELQANNSGLDNDPQTARQRNRIAKLRAEIDLMRTSYQNRASVSDSLNSNHSNRSAADDDGQPTKIASTVTELEPDISSISAEAISLKLPPLPPSEEYLPNTFDGYVWPAQGVLTSGYGWRWGRLHKGIDIAAPVGTPIFAAASGKVISAGWNSGGYGNLVKIRHLDGSVTLYAHNNRISVRKGQKVTQGQKIAEMGNTGFSTGPHLHFEIHSKKFGVTNPLALLKR